MYGFPSHSENKIVNVNVKLQNPLLLFVIYQNYQTTKLQLFNFKVFMLPLHNHSYSISTAKPEVFSPNIFHDMFNCLRLPSPITVCVHTVAWQY